MANKTEDITLTIEELNEIERLKYLPFKIVLLVLMIIGIVGNLLVIIIYKRKFKRSSARVYIICLAVADLAVCIVGIPYHVLDLTFLLTYTDQNVCKVLSFLIGACTLSSVFILLVVGLDRYLKVCRPLKKQIVDFGDRKACLIAVLIAVVVSIPHGVIYGNSSVKRDSFNVTGVECFIDDQYQGSAVGYLGFNMLVFILSVIFLIIIYGLIGRKIYQQDKLSGEININKRKKVCFCCTLDNNEKEDDEEENDEENREAENARKQDNEDENQHLNEKSENKRRNPNVKAVMETMIRHRKPGAKVNEKNTRKITLMMMTITVVFIVAYFPFILISIMDNIDDTLWSDNPDLQSILLDFCLRIYIVNNIANPIIYSFWDQRFRKETVNILRKLFCHSKNSKGKSENSSGNTQAYSRDTDEVTLK